MPWHQCARPHSREGYNYYITCYLGNITVQEIWATFLNVALVTGYKNVSPYPYLAMKEELNFSLFWHSLYAMVWVKWSSGFCCTQLACYDQAIACSLYVCVEPEIDAFGTCDQDLWSVHLFRTQGHGHEQGYCLLRCWLYILRSNLN